jgi:hypothetical protein
MVPQDRSMAKFGRFPRRPTQKEREMDEKDSERVSYAATGSTRLSASLQDNCARS